MQVSFATHVPPIQAIRDLKLSTNSGKRSICWEDPAVCFPHIGLTVLEITQDVINSNSFSISATIFDAFTEECKTIWRTEKVKL